MNERELVAQYASYSLQDFAWEFLRRNPTYKQHWDKYNGKTNTDQAANLWLLEKLYSPDKSAKEIVVRWTYRSSISLLYKQGDVYLSGHKDSASSKEGHFSPFVAIEFDTREDIGRQLSLAKVALTQEYRIQRVQMNRSDLHKKKLPVYLKAYDLSKDGKRFVEIAHIISPNLNPIKPTADEEDYITSQISKMLAKAKLLVANPHWLLYRKDKVVK